VTVAGYIAARGREGQLKKREGEAARGRARRKKRRTEPAGVLRANIPADNRGEMVE
jgi:hypothetical protein